MRTVSTVGTKTCENGLSAGGLQRRTKLGQADVQRHMHCSLHVGTGMCAKQQTEQERRVAAACAGHGCRWSVLHQSMLVMLPVTWQCRHCTCKMS